jgi:DNA adenine methylase
MDTYGALARAPIEVADAVASLRPSRELYYQIRRSRSTDAIQRAAEFIYLNKLAWNGLYRVNASGEFNVPYGRPKTDFVADRANLLACAQLTAQPDVRLSSVDFAATLASVEAGDLVYLDPPYITRHNNNGFVDYNEKLFKWSDQERLAELALRLSEKGAVVIVSNAYHHDVLALYANFTVIEIQRISTLAGDKSSRGPVSEVILTNALDVSGDGSGHGR